MSKHHHEIANLHRKRSKRTSTSSTMKVIVEFCAPTSIAAAPAREYAPENTRESISALTTCPTSRPKQHPIMMLGMNSPDGMGAPKVIINRKRYTAAAIARVCRLKGSCGTAMVTIRLIDSLRGDFGQAVTCGMQICTKFSGSRASAAMP